MLCCIIFPMKDQRKVIICNLKPTPSDPKTVMSSCKCINQIVYCRYCTFDNEHTVAGPKPFVSVTSGNPPSKFVHASLWRTRCPFASVQLESNVSCQEAELM